MHVFCALYYYLLKLQTIFGLCKLRHALFFFYDRYTVLIGVQMALKLSVEGRIKFLKCKISLSNDSIDSVCPYDNLVWVP